MSNPRRFWPWLLLAAVGVPAAAFWALLLVIAWESFAAPPDPSSPARLPAYSRPPSPDVTRRHPLPESEPGPGYEWVRAHRQGSQWVDGYWRRRPGYRPPLPSATPSVD